MFIGSRQRLSAMNIRPRDSAKIGCRVFGPNPREKTGSLFLHHPSAEGFVISDPETMVLSGGDCVAKIVAKRPDGSSLRDNGRVPDIGPPIVPHQDMGRFNPPMLVTLQRSRMYSVP